MSRQLSVALALLVVLGFGLAPTAVAVDPGHAGIPTDEDPCIKFKEGFPVFGGETICGPDDVLPSG